MPKPLSLCREEDNVYIQRIGGDGVFKNRLLDLGFRRGTLLSVVKYAPLKDPMEVALCGSHITLRVEEAERILVDIEPPAPLE
jgi:Fe2+ transport system protein FeoA